MATAKEIFEANLAVINKAQTLWKEDETSRQADYARIIDGFYKAVEIADTDEKMTFLECCSRDVVDSIMADLYRLGLVNDEITSDYYDLTPKEEVLAHGRELQKAADAKREEIENMIKEQQEHERDFQIFQSVARSQSKSAEDAEAKMKEYEEKAGN